MSTSSKGRGPLSTINIYKYPIGFITESKLAWHFGSEIFDYIYLCNLCKGCDLPQGFASLHGLGFVISLWLMVSHLFLAMALTSPIDTRLSYDLNVM